MKVLCIYSIVGLVSLTILHLALRLDDASRRFAIRWAVIYFVSLGILTWTVTGRASDGMGIIGGAGIGVSLYLLLAGLPARTPPTSRQSRYPPTSHPEDHTDWPAYRP